MATIREINTYKNEIVYPVTKSVATIMENGNTVEYEVNRRLIADKIIDTLQECIDSAETGAPAGSVAVKDIYEAFLDGCRTIARAIAAEGVPTSDNASPATMATNIASIRRPIIDGTIFAHDSSGIESIDNAYYKNTKINYNPSYRKGQKKIVDQLTYSEIKADEKCPATSHTGVLTMQEPNSGETFYSIKCSVCKKEYTTTGDPEYYWNHTWKKHLRTIKFMGYHAQTLDSDVELPTETT